MGQMGEGCRTRVKQSKQPECQGLGGESAAWRSNGGMRETRARVSMETVGIIESSVPDGDVASNKSQMKTVVCYESQQG